MKYDTKYTKCNEITENQWMEICGLLTLNRELKKQTTNIESIIEEKYPFIEGYFTDETWEDSTLSQVRKKWLDNNLINMKIVKEKKPHDR